MLSTTNLFKGVRMNEEEKKAFLKQMGYSGSALRTETIVPKPTKEKVDNVVDKNELLGLNRIFNPPIPKTKKD